MDVVRTDDGEEKQDSWVKDVVYSFASFVLLHNRGVA